MKIGDIRYGQAANGDVLEYVAQRVLTKAEVAELKTKERTARKEAIGNLIAAVLGAVTGSNGEDECVACGHHHAEPFTHIEVKYDTIYPDTVSVTKVYTSTEEADTAMAEHFAALRSALAGQRVVEIDSEDGDEDEDHPTFVRTYAAGHGAKQHTVGMQTIRLLNGPVPDGVEHAHAH